MTSAPAPRHDLSKKIPVNPKFAHVKSVLDTGASATKYKDHLEHIRSNYKIKKDEIFKRIKVNMFAQLVVEVADAEDELLGEELDEAATFPGAPTPQRGSSRAAAAPEDDRASVRTDMTARTGFLSLIHGVSERDTKPAAPPPPPPSRLPFILLDVRDVDDYKACHVVGAQSYPPAMLSRATNYYTAEMYQYINKPGRIVIIYDEDERIAPGVATLLVQRGVDNVFVLSGGLKVLGLKFPEGFVVGELPASCRPPPPPKKPASRSSSLNSSGPAALGAGSSAAGRKTSSGVAPSTPAGRSVSGAGGGGGGGGSGGGGGAAAATAAAAKGGAEDERAAASGEAEEASDSVLMLLPLTRSNLERIRVQLEENLLADDASSMASTARTPTRGATPSRPGATPARGTAPSRAAATPSSRSVPATPMRTASTSKR